MPRRVFLVLLLLVLLLAACASESTYAQREEKKGKNSLLQQVLQKKQSLTVALQVHARSNPEDQQLSGIVNIVLYNQKQPSFKDSENSLFNNQPPQPIQSIYGVFRDHGNNVQYEFDSILDKTIMYSQTQETHQQNEETKNIVALEIDGGSSAGTSSAIVDELTNALVNSAQFDGTEQGNVIFDKQVEACIEAAKASKNTTVWFSSFLGKDYVVCHTSSSVPVLRIIGKDIFATAHLNMAQDELKQFKIRSNLVIPKHKIAALIPAKASNYHKAMTENANSKQQSQPWYQGYESSCQLEWSRGGKCEEHEQKVLKNTIPTPQRVCIFLHGAGNEIVGEPANNTWPDYWGASLPNFTPQCSERWYIREDTVHFGWDDHALQQRYCQLALRGQADIHQDSGKPPMIRNKVIFAHSMANLILAAAIKHGYCDFDSETSSWYSIQAPYLGSPAASYLSSLCRNSSFYDLFYYTARWLHLCNATTMSENRVYRTLEASYCDVDGLCVRELEKMSLSRIKGSMCGNSAMGLFSSWSVTFYTLSTLIGFQEFNDGLVGISSCQLDTKYDMNPYSNYYLAGINHRDGTCFNGNGWLSQGAPCDFYVNKY